MTDLPSAQQKIWQAVQPIGTEIVPLSQSVGRRVVEAIYAPLDLPVFDNSSLDGYAVCALDLPSANPQNAVSLSLRGNVAAGDEAANELHAGECLRIFTGAPVPAGATAVVGQELAQIDASDASRIWFMTAPGPGDNIRRQGSDIRRGNMVLKAGVRITPAQVFLLAALGVEQVRVGRRPVIGLVATGNELVEGGHPLGPGKIYDSNRAGLAALISQAGGWPRPYALVADQLQGTRQALAQAFAEGDAVITSGGVSVGDTDCVKAALEAIGGRIELWRVAIKPGKPFLLGSWQGKWLFGLPGNPVSARMTFAALVGPALAKMQGAIDWPIGRIMGWLQERIINPSDRCLLFPIALAKDGRIGATGGEASQVMSSMSQAQGWIEIPPGATLESGTPVIVNLLE